MQKTSPKSFLIAIFLFFGTLFFACKKTADKQNDYTDDPSKLTALQLQKFLHVSDTTPKPIITVINAINRRADKSNFIYRIINEVGYPLWEKAFINTKGGVFTETNGSDTTFAIIPIVPQGTKEVNGMLACRLVDDSVHINFVREKDYKAFGFNNSMPYSADKLVGLMMYLQNRAFGAKSFILSDARLFYGSTADSTKQKLVRFRLDENNQNQSNILNQNIESTSVEICYSAWGPLCGDPLVCMTYGWVEKCDTYFIWTAESLPPSSGGGGGGDGGDNGGAGGGGGGGGGGGTSIQSLLTQILGLNINQENFIWSNWQFSEVIWNYIHSGDGTFTSTERKVNSIIHLNYSMTNNQYLQFSFDHYNNGPHGQLFPWFSQLCIEGLYPILYSNIQLLKLNPWQAYLLFNNPTISTQVNQFLLNNQNSIKAKSLAVSAINNAILYGDISLPDFIANDDAILFNTGGGNGAKPIANIENYIKCFTNNDNKPVSGYKFAVFAEQPDPGTRKIYTGPQVSPNPGHSFIMIERSYTDGTKNNIVIGFYPNSPVNAVLNQNTLGKLMDNEEHDYNVKVELGIDKNKFDQIIAYIKSKEIATYNLQTYNCTDFAFEASQLAGINFRKTSGCWTGNSCGLSPANLGQDMIEMKFTAITPANRINFPSMTQAGTGDGPCN